MAIDASKYNSEISYNIGDAFSPDGARAFEIMYKCDTISLIVLPEQANKLAAILNELGCIHSPSEI
jgi:hypothetical protein